MSMLAKDNECHDNMSDEKKEKRWHHVIKPLLNSLGFKMVSREPTKWRDKKYRVPDPSLFVNHEVVHYIAHQKDCEQAIKQWEEHAMIGDHYIDGKAMCVPGRLEQYHQPSRHDVNDSTSGVDRALARCQAFQLHGALDAIDDWTDHVSYMEASIERLNIWNRPRKTNDIEMASTYVGRTPFTFIKSALVASPTRKNDELSNSQESDTKRRKVEDIVSLLDSAPSTGLGDVTTGTSSGEVLASRGGNSGELLMLNTNDVLDLQRDLLDRNEPSPVDVLDQGEDEDLVLSTTKELKVMKEEDEIKFWKQMWKECEL
eukprot:5982367-Amphidinium_carterae.2